MSISKPQHTQQNDTFINNSENEMCNPKHADGFVTIDSFGYTVNLYGFTNIW